MKELITGKFKVSPNDYFRAELYESARKLFFIFLILIVLSIILSIYNIAFVFVGLIIIFLVVPSYIALIYFSKLLTIEAQQNLAVKHLIIEENKFIKVVYDDDKISNHSIEWGIIHSVKKRNGHIEIRADNKKLLLLVPQNIIEPNLIFPDFCKDMSWEERKE